MGPPRRPEIVTNGRARYEPAAAVSQQRHSQPSPHRQTSPLQQAQPATQSHAQVSHRPQALSEQHAPAVLAADAVVVDDFARMACVSTRIFRLRHSRTASQPRSLPLRQALRTGHSTCNCRRRRKGKVRLHCTGSRRRRRTCSPRTIRRRCWSSSSGRWRPWRWRPTQT